MYIEKDKDGKWMLRDKVKMPDGQFHDLKVRGYDKKSDAKDDYENQLKLFIERWEAKNQKDKLRHMSGNTLWEICEEYRYNWSLQVKESSMLKYDNDLKKLIYFFGGDKVSDQVFTEENMLAWKKHVLEMNIVPAGKNNLLSMTKNIIDRTIRRGKVIDIAAANRSTLALETIRVEKKPNLNKDKNVWSMEEYDAFISTFDRNEYDYFVFLTFCNTGMRRGELSGLQWKHIDFFNKTITVEQQANNQLRKGHAVITSPKSFSGYRKIDLCDFYVNEMRRLKNAIKPDPEDFVFIGKRGGNLAPTTMGRILDKHIQMAGVKRITSHGFRHTYATLLYHEEASLKYMQEKLGHASIEETMNTYTHVLNGDGNEVMNKLDTVMQH